MTTNVAAAVGHLHGRYVHTHRVRVLCERLSRLLPQGASVLDIGCGDGLLASLIGKARPDVRVSGIDVLVRSDTHVPVSAFDGRIVPRASKSVDVVLFVDVLHHAADPMTLMREATRVARQAVVIKDHTLNGFLAYRTLKFMDDVSNKRHGIALPHNYWPEGTWRNVFPAVGLNIVSWENKCGLYTWPANFLFERNLHFIAKLQPSDH
jgi:ubiquinone/menaquinone biosynthesis C-methylase UbiE